MKASSNHADITALVYSDALKHNLAGEFSLTEGITVSAWLAESKFDRVLTLAPVLVVLNGDALLESEFCTELQPGDVQNYENDY